MRRTVRTSKAVFKAIQQVGKKANDNVPNFNEWAKLALTIASIYKLFHS
jgi:hypothetical protein